MNELTLDKSKDHERQAPLAAKRSSSGAKLAKTAVPLPAVTLPTAPTVFNFVNYREYLKAFFAYKKSKATSYSFTTFALQAGLGASMRGYPKMVMEGVRNLSPHSIRSFSDALSLEPREAMYFENLVYFNQSKSGRDKDHYFQRLSISAEGSESDAFRVLRSQYTFFSHWYLVAVRELVALPTFKEDSAWIASQLRGKITRTQAQEAMEHLSRLGLIQKNEKGCWCQTHPIVNTTEDTFTLVIHKFYLEMIDRAREALKEDPYDQRHCQSVTLSMDTAKLPDLVQAISNFRSQVLRDFGTSCETPNSVVQLNLQLFQFTPLQPHSQEKKK